MTLDGQPDEHRRLHPEQYETLDPGRLVTRRVGCVTVGQRARGRRIDISASVQRDMQLISRRWVVEMLRASKATDGLGNDLVCLTAVF